MTQQQMIDGDLNEPTGNLDLETDPQQHSVEDSSKRIADAEEPHHTETVWMCEVAKII